MVLIGALFFCFIFGFVSGALCTMISVKRTLDRR